MAEPVNTMPLSGWGRYPTAECAVYRPEKMASVHRALAEGAYETYIGRGMGRSYGDLAINGDGGVIDFQRMNRILAFDDATGVVRCEAGVNFPRLIETFLPRGYFLPVTPGTKFITVGGAIANDVHGKNHHSDGSFGHALIDFELLTASGDVMTCSREENSDVFWATVGGGGLTGLILTASFRLQRVPSGYTKVDYTKTADLDGVLDAMDRSDKQYRYSMAWVDGLAKGKHLGRSVLMAGNPAEVADLPSEKQSAPFDVKLRGFQPNLPIDFPQFALNPLSIKAFNQGVYTFSPSSEGNIVDYDTYFFPLDFIHHWNRMYGKRGFTQYQVTVPLTERAALVKILERACQQGKASFLAVLKKMGEGNDGMLSHPFEGYTLTLDFAINDSLFPFLHDLDRITVEHGGRLYLAKDATMTPESFRAMYPRVDEFLEVKHRLDPENVFSSNLSRRVGLTPGGAA